jgi:hypothetical protein
MKWFMRFNVSAKEFPYVQHKESIEMVKIRLSLDFDLKIWLPISYALFVQASGQQSLQ